MRIRTHTAAALVLLLGLGACGGADDDTPPSGTDPFPLAVGSQWSTQFTSSMAETGIRTYEVTGTDTVDGNTAHVVADRFGADTLLRRYVHTDTAVWRLANDAAPIDEQSAGAFLLLQLPLRTGERWTQLDESADSGIDVDGDGLAETLRTQAEAVVEQSGPVTTPAGRFDSAYLVTSTYRRGLVNPATGEIYEPEVQSVVHEWYVPGVGRVARDRLVTPAGGWREYESTEALSSYRLNTP